jgi:hypothetical protein
MDDINDHIFGGDLPVDPEEPEEFATGGRVGFNQGSKLTDYIKTNISASTSSSSPEEGVKNQNKKFWMELLVLIFH